MVTKMTFYLSLVNHIVSRELVQYPVILQQASFTWVNSIMHLGHVLTHNYNANTDDIQQQLFDFISQTNYFIVRFDHLPAPLKIKLFCNFCLSFYGCTL